jgi:hypothetical protein
VYVLFLVLCRTRAAVRSGSELFSFFAFRSVLLPLLLLLLLAITLNCYLEGGDDRGADSPPFIFDAVKTFRSFSLTLCPLLLPLLLKGGGAVGGAIASSER